MPIALNNKETDRQTPGSSEDTRAASHIFYNFHLLKFPVFRDIIKADETPAITGKFPFETIANKSIE